MGREEGVVEMTKAACRATGVTGVYMVMGSGIAGWWGAELLGRGGWGGEGEGWRGKLENHFLLVVAMAGATTVGFASPVADPNYQQLLQASGETASQVLSTRLRASFRICVSQGLMGHMAHDW